MSSHSYSTLHNNSIHFLNQQLKKLKHDPQLSKPGYSAGKINRWNVH